MENVTKTLDSILLKLESGEQLTDDEIEVAVSNALLQEDEEDGE